jgi:nucleoside-diphosphate-sugar epimerase
MGKNKKKIVAVIGAKGFVGEAICQEIKSRSDLELITISRGDNMKDLINMAEIIIHTSNPAKRFAAEKNPEIDFVETVQKTFDILQLCKNKKIVLISSLSVRTQLNTHYGRHRKACEMLINNGENLIIRLGPMYGGGRTQDSIHDILLNRTVYVSGKTQYAYVDVAYSAKKIIDLIDEKGIYEVGAKNGIKLDEIKDYLKSNCVFQGFDDTQIPIDPPNDAPDANEVLKFCKQEIKHI